MMMILKSQKWCLRCLSFQKVNEPKASPTMKMKTLKTLKVIMMMVLAMLMMMKSLYPSQRQ